MQEPTRKTLTRPTLSKPKAKSAKDSTRTTKAEFKPKDKPELQIKSVEPDLLEVKSDSLAFSLAGAAQAVAYVLEGTALPQALSRVFMQLNATPQTRGAIQDIAYRTMRQVGRVDALITLMTNKPVEPPLLYSLMCCALSLLVIEKDETPPYGEFVVVDQAVNAAASNSHMVFAKGMVNAVLRRFLTGERKSATNGAETTGGHVELSSMVGRSGQGGVSGTMAKYSQVRQYTSPNDFACQSTPNFSRIVFKTFSR